MRAVLKGAVVATAVVSLASCSMVQTAAQAAGRATGVGEVLSAEGGDREGVLEMILAGLLAGMNEMLAPQRDFWLGLAATLDQLALADTAITHGLPVAVLQICAAGGPDDLDPEADQFARVVEDDGEVAHLRLGGLLGEAALPIELEVVARELDAVVRLRGGGWLLCGLTEGDVELDGESVYLGDPELLAPELDVSPWPEPSVVEEPPGAAEAATVTPDEVGPPVAVEVSLELTLSHQTLLDILSAELVTIWLADEPVELFPEDSPAVAQMVRFLEGDDLVAPAEPADDFEILVIDPEGVRAVENELNEDDFTL